MRAPPQTERKSKNPDDSVLFKQFRKLLLQYFAALQRERKAVEEKSALQIFTQKKKTWESDLKEEEIMKMRMEEMLTLQSFSKRNKNKMTKKEWKREQLYKEEEQNDEKRMKESFKKNKKKWERADFKGKKLKKKEWKRDQTEKVMPDWCTTTTAGAAIEQKSRISPFQQKISPFWSNIYQF